MSLGLLFGISCSEERLHLFLLFGLAFAFLLFGLAFSFASRCCFSLSACFSFCAAICDNTEERGNIDDRANREVAVHRNEEGAPAIRRGSSDIGTRGIIIDDSVDDSDAMSYICICLIYFL